MKKNYFLLVFIFIINFSQAQTSSNTCAGAASLTVSSSCNSVLGTTVGATESLNGPSDCLTASSPTSFNDVWYKFTATATSATITVDGSGSSLDAVIELYDGSTGACPFSINTAIGCSDATGGSGIEEINATGLTIGTTYFVRIYDYDGTNDGTFDICVTSTTSSGGGGSAPANDFCSAAINLTPSSTCNSVSGTTVDATASLNGPSDCLSGISTPTSFNDVWYKFTATATTSTITVDGSMSSLDAVIELYNGTTGTCPFSVSSALFCSDIGTQGGTEEINATGLTIGSVYYVRIYDYDGTNDGTFNICVKATSSSSSPANDVCGAAINLTPSSTCNSVSGTTVGATVSLNGPSDCLSGISTPTSFNDVWYKFTATAANQIITVDGASSTIDPVIELYNGSTGACPFSVSSALFCSDNSGHAGSEEITATGLTVGSLYFVRVYDYEGNDDGTFDICVKTGSNSSSSSDECSGAVALTMTTTDACNPTSGTTVGASSSYGGTTCSPPLLSAVSDVWYKFTVTSPTVIIDMQSGSGFNGALEVYNGTTCPTDASPALDCQNATGNAGLETITLTSQTIGDNIYVRALAGNLTDGTFTICAHSDGTILPNDNCAGATNLIVSSTCTPTSGTSNGGTQSFASICNASVGNTATPDDDVWYKFTASAATQKVTVAPGPAMDAVIEVYTGCATQTPLACEDSAGTNIMEDLNLTGLTAGTTYYIRTYNYYANGGDFDICVTGAVTALPNDNCVFATNLSVSSICTPTSGTSNGATQSFASICNASVGNTATPDDDVWYKFTATAAAQKITVTPGPAMDAVIEVYTGCATQTALACEDSAGTNIVEDLSLTGLSVGTTYYIRTYNYYANGGAFDICVTGAGGVSGGNDDCASATTLTSATTCNSVTGTTATATESFSGSASCLGTNPSTSSYKDVWYKFVATSASQKVIVAPTTGLDAVIELYATSCPTSASGAIACGDHTSSTFNDTLYATGLTVGSTYYVRVYDYDGNSNGAFAICVTGTPSSGISNDDCAGATNITPDSNCSIISATTVGATQSIAGGCSSGANPNDDVWFKFTATTTSNNILVNPRTSGMDPVVELWQGCSASTSIKCIDSLGQNDEETLTLTGLTIGAVYYVRVYDYTSAAGFPFDICIQSIGSASGTNDDCSGAQTISNNSTCVTTAVNTTTATQSFATSASCSGSATPDDDMWYKFTATSTSHDIKATPQGNSDAVIELYATSCPTDASNAIGCSDDNLATSATEIITATGLTIGQTYYIRIYDYGTGGGNFDLCVTNGGASSGNGDEPCTAIRIPSVSSACNYVDYSMSTSTPSSVPVPTGCGTTWQSNYKDIWFSIVVPANGSIVANTYHATGDNTHIDDGMLALYKYASSGTQNCTNLQLITCNDDGTLGSSSVLQPILIANGLTPGDTVYLRFTGKNVARDNFELCVTSPDNDGCDEAKYVCDLGVGYSGTTSAAYGKDWPGNIRGNDENAGNPPTVRAGCQTTSSGGIFGGNHTNGSGCYDVVIDNNSWIKFTASSTTAALSVAITNCLRNLGVQMQVFEAVGTDCKTAVYTAKSNFQQGTSNYTLNLTGLTIGRDYYLMVDGFAGDLCNYTLTASSGVQPAGITTTGNDTTICKGETITLDGVVDPRVTAYNWLPGGQSTSSITVSPTVTTTYTLEVTGLCGKTKTATKTIYVDSVATTPITGSSTGCKGGSSTFSVPLVAGQTYNWSVTAGGILSSTTSNSVTINWAASASSAVVTLKTTNAAGCSTTVTKNITLTNGQNAAIVYAPAYCKNAPTNPTPTGTAGTFTATPAGLVFVSTTTGQINLASSAPGTYVITNTLAASGGCAAASDTEQVVIRAIPNPVITGPSPVCPNGTGSTYAVTAVAGNTYSWSVTGGTISGSSTSNSISVNWGAGPTGTVNMTQTSAGCSDTAMKNVTFSNAPGAFTMSFAPNDSICKGTATTITVNGVSSASFYSAPTGGSALGTSPFTTPALNTTTDYYVEGTIAGGCTNTTRQKVTVTVVPDPTPPGIIYANNDTICAGASTTLTATPAQPNVSYKFYTTATGGTLVGASPLTVTPSSTTDYYLEVKSIYGCLATPTRTKYTVTVLPLPPAPSLVYSNNDSVCFGKKTTITATPATVGVTYNFYTASTGGTIAGSSPFTTPNLLRDTTYYLETVNTFGCRSSANRTPVTIKVMPNPTPAAIVTNPNDSICLGKSTTLSATGSTGGNNITYNFYTASTGGTLVGASPKDITPTVTTYYYLEVKNDFGCVSKPLRDSVRIVVNPLPNAPVLAGTNNSICEGKTTTLTATVIPANSTITWYDVSTGGVPLGVGTNFVSPILGSNSIFYLESVSPQGCINAGGRVSVAVTVKPLPRVNITSDAPDNTIYTGQLATFTVNPATYQVYQFYVDKDQVQSNSSTQYSSVTLTDGQVVKVKVIDNGCENWSLDSVLMHVKPISNAFTPNGDGKNDVFLKGLEMSIYNRWGQKLFEGKDGWDGTYNGAKVSPGTYYYIVNLKQIGTSEIKTLNGPVTVIED